VQSEVLYPTSDGFYSAADGLLHGDTGVLALSSEEHIFLKFALFDTDFHVESATLELRTQAEFAEGSSILIAKDSNLWDSYSLADFEMYEHLDSSCMVDNHRCENVTQECVTCTTCTVSVHFGCRVSEDGSTNCDANDTETCVTDICEGEACDFSNPLCAVSDCPYLQCGDNCTEILSCEGGLCDGRQLFNMTDVQDINVASEDTVLSFDLTSFVQGSLDNEDAYLSLRLSLAGEDGEFLFGSSCAIESYRPSLKIMYSPASAVLDIDTEAVCAYTGRCDDEISMEPQSVTFTGSNWFVPQTISVFPVDDQIDEEPFHPASILHEIFSADEGYVSLGAAPTVQFHPVKEINVTVEDNDEAFVLLSRSNLTLPEDGVAEYSLHLLTEPIANVSILISTGSQLSLRTPPHSIVHRTQMGRPSNSAI